MQAARIEEQTSHDATRLCHDLRQYVAAGRLLSGGAETTEAEVRHRLDTLGGIFAAMDDLIRSELDDDRVAVVDLVHVVEECVQVVRITSAASILTDLDGPARACIDATLMRRAVINVLDNASRAAGRGGNVEVRVRRRPQENWIEVADTGPGFARIQPVTGHGLSIVDQALRATQGRLEIASGPGPGTTVRLRIPAEHGGEPR